MLKTRVFKISIKNEDLPERIMIMAQALNSKRAVPDTKPPGQTYILWVMLVVSFTITFASSSINLALPDIALEFNSKATLLGWTITGYTLANAVFAVPFGRIADLTGRRRIFLIGVLILTIVSIACIFAWSVQALIILRIIQGVGAAMVFCTNQAILISTFPPEKRGKILGYSTASIYTGLSTGPIIGGLMNHYWGWKSIFIFISVITVTILIIAIKKLPKLESPSQEGSFDKAGNILYVLMISCIMYGFSTFTESLWSKLLLAAGLVLVGFFISHELKCASPIMDVGLFARNKGYGFSNLVALLNYGATFALGYLMSIYLQVVMGYDSQISGLILIIQPLFMAVLSPFTGRLSDRVSAFKLSSFGMALCALALFSFTFISTDYALIRIIISLVIMGIGIAFFSTPNTNAVMSCVSQKDYGVASSTLATMRSIGQTSSMTIITLVVAVKMGSAAFAEVPAELLVSTMRIGFAIFTILCVIGVFVSLLRNKPVEK